MQTRYNLEMPATADLTPTLLTLGGVFLGWHINAKIDHNRMKLREKLEYHKLRSNALSDLMGKAWAIATMGEEVNNERLNVSMQSASRAIAAVSQDQKETYITQVRGLQVRSWDSRHNLLLLMTEAISVAEKYGELDAQTKLDNIHLADYLTAWCKMVLKSVDHVQTEDSVFYLYADALIGDLRDLRTFEEGLSQACLKKSKPKEFSVLADPSKMFLNSPRMKAMMTSTNGKVGKNSLWEIDLIKPGR